MAILRRARGLSEGDRALWHAYTARTAVAPLPGKALAGPPPLPAAPAAAAAPPPPLPPRPAGPRPHPELHVGTAPGGLDAKRWRDLRRGRTRAERTLDLHGRRAQEAHDAVRRFLAEAQADGLRCVAIVTGKGSTAEGGVLRRELPHWLNAPELRPLLLGAAHPHATNPGAVYLLLRRAHGARDNGYAHGARDGGQAQGARDNGYAHGARDGGQARGARATGSGHGAGGTRIAEAGRGAVPADGSRRATRDAPGGAAESFAALLGRTVRRLRRP